MRLKYHCLICTKYEENELDVMREKRLFLHFDNDKEHRPICKSCRKVIDTLLHPDTYMGWDWILKRKEEGRAKQFRSKKRSLLDFI